MTITGRGFYRLGFADQVAIVLALGKHTPGRFREQSKDVMEGAAALVNFITVLWRHYLASRDLDLALPPP